MTRQWFELCRRHLRTHVKCLLIAETYLGHIGSRQHLHLVEVADTSRCPRCARRKFELGLWTRRPAYPASCPRMVFCQKTKHTAVSSRWAASDETVSAFSTPTSYIWLRSREGEQVHGALVGRSAKEVGGDGGASQSCAHLNRGTCIRQFGNAPTIRRCTSRGPDVDFGTTRSTHIFAPRRRRTSCSGTLAFLVVLIDEF